MKKRILPILIILILFSTITYAATFNDFLSFLFGTQNDTQAKSSTPQAPSAQTIQQAPAAYDGVCNSVSELDQLPPGHWCVTQTNTMYDVRPNPMPVDLLSDPSGNTLYPNNGGVFAYSGGAYDTLRDRLIV